MTPLGSQAFIPLADKPYLVADSAEKPDATTAKAFVANGAQGVNYHAGIWHHPVITLKTITDFLVINRTGDEPNCDKFFLPEPLVISSPPK